MNETLNQVDPGTHLFALAIILIVAGFVAAIFAGAVLHERKAKELELRNKSIMEDSPEYVDSNYYPDEDPYR